MAEKRYGLPRGERLRKRKDVDRAFREGKKLTQGTVYARYVPNNLPYSRFGTAVPMRVGGAVQRNRARRLLKEACRLHKHEMPAGYDIVLLPGHRWADHGLESVEEAVVKIARKLSEAESTEE